MFPFSLSRIIMSDLLLGIVLSVCICWFHNMVTLPPWLVSPDFDTCSYQCFWSNYTPVSLHMLKCSCAHTQSCLFMYCSFASIGHADIIWYIVSSNYYYYYYYYFLCLRSEDSSRYPIWNTLSMCFLRRGPNCTCLKAIRTSNDLWTWQWYLRVLRAVCL